MVESLEIQPTVIHIVVAQVWVSRGKTDPPVVAVKSHVAGFFVLTDLNPDQPSEFVFGIRSNSITENPRLRIEVREESEWTRAVALAAHAGGFK